MSAGETVASRGRIKAVRDWLTRRANRPIGRLALQWFRAYFAASRSSACAVTIYSMLSVLPVMLVAIAYFHPSGSDTNAFAERLIDHLKLNGTTARLVHDAFGSASSNALAASITAAVGFLLWGIGIGQIYQDVYARAWGIKVGSLADQGLFTIFFFVLSGACALAVISAARLREMGWVVLVPAWLVASTIFWLWVPRFLLHRRIDLRALLPGALLASLLLGGTVATAPLFLAAPMNANGKMFGAFGVVLTVLGYAFALITMSLVCAVFSPVWASWRQTEQHRRDTSGLRDKKQPAPPSSAR